MRAGVFRGVRKIVVEDAPDPEPGPRDIVLRVAACGICGSDLHTYTHGSFVLAGQIMGHEFAGEVVEVGDEVESISVGDRVTALPLAACGRCPRCAEGNRHLCETGLAASIAYGLPGAFAEYVCVPNAVLGDNVYALPEEVSLEEGALVEPLSVALHAVTLAVPRPGDSAVVIGLGSIGQNVVQTLKAMGVATVIGVDVSPIRLETAGRLGADVLIDADREDVLERVRGLLGRGAYGVGSRADLVFECSGVPRMLQQAIELVRAGGKVLVTALYDALVPIDATMVVQKELSFLGTFAYRGEFAEAVELIRSGRVNVAPLVSHRYPLEALPEAFETQLAKERSVKVLVQLTEA